MSGLPCILVLDVMAGCLNCVSTQGHGCSLAPRANNKQVGAPYRVIVSKRFHIWQIYRFMHRLGQLLVPDDMSFVDFSPPIRKKSAGKGYSSLTNKELAKASTSTRKQYDLHRKSSDWKKTYYGVSYTNLRQPWKDWKDLTTADFRAKYPSLTWDCLTPLPHDIDQALDDYYALLDKAMKKKKWVPADITSECYLPEGCQYEDMVGWRPTLIADGDGDDDGKGDKTDVGESRIEDIQYVESSQPWAGIPDDTHRGSSPGSNASIRELSPSEVRSAIISDKSVAKGKARASNRKNKRNDSQYIGMCRFRCAEVTRNLI